MTSKESLIIHSQCKKWTFKVSEAEENKQAVKTADIKKMMN